MNYSCYKSSRINKQRHCRAFQIKTWPPADPNQYTPRRNSKQAESCQANSDRGHSVYNIIPEPQNPHSCFKACFTKTQKPHLPQTSTLRFNTFPRFCHQRVGSKITQVFPFNVKGNTLLWHSVCKMFSVFRTFADR